MKIPNSKECPFCNATLSVEVTYKCTRCGFPVYGTLAEQESFKVENENLEQLILEADAALGWARFGMLWPWLGTALLGAYYFLRPPMNIYSFAGDLVLSSLFVACYFAVNKKPLAILGTAFIVLLMITLYGVFAARVLYIIPITWIQFILPLILLMMYGNAWLLRWKLEKMLERK